MSTNMDLFNKFTAQLFDKLLDHFPVEEEIKLEDFEYLDNKENDKIFFSSIRFFERERFITYSDAVSGAFLSVALTAKGLAVLNSFPESLETKEPLGNQLRSALKSGGAEALKTLINEIIKTGVTLMLRGG